MSHDSQVAEVALSLSDFNPVAKMAPNPALLCPMRQGAFEEVNWRWLESWAVSVGVLNFGRHSHAVWDWNKETNSVIGDTQRGVSLDRCVINTRVTIRSSRRYLKLGA